MVSDFPKAKQRGKLSCDGFLLRVCVYLRNLNSMVYFHIMRRAESADYGTAKVANPSARALEASPHPKVAAENIPWGWRSTIKYKRFWSTSKANTLYRFINYTPFSPNFSPLPLSLSIHRFPGDLLTRHPAWWSRESRELVLLPPSLPACNILTPGRPQVSNKIGIHEKTRAAPPQLASWLPPAAPPHQRPGIPELSTAPLTVKSPLYVPALSCCNTIFLARSCCSMISSQVLVSLAWSVTLEDFKSVSCRGFCSCHHRL